MTLFYEDPFQQIVGIHFPTTGFVALALQASGGGSVFPSCHLFANGLDLGDMFGSINSKFAKTDTPYKETNTSSASDTVTIWQLELLFSDGWAGMRAFILYDERGPIALPFPYENWIYQGSLTDLSTIFSSGIAGSLRGTTAAEIVAQMEAEHIFGNSDHRIGPIVYGPTTISGTGTTWQENAIVILDLRQIKKALPGGPRNIEIKTDLAAGWQAQAFTFKKNPALLPIGSKNTAGPVYPLMCVDSRSERSSGETITTGPADFTIDTKTLKFV